MVACCNSHVTVVEISHKDRAHVVFHRGIAAVGVDYIDVSKGRVDDADDCYTVRVRFVGDSSKDRRCYRNAVVEVDDRRFEGDIHPLSWVVAGDKHPPFSFCLLKNHVKEIARRCYRMTILVDLEDI